MIDRMPCTTRSWLCTPDRAPLRKMTRRRPLIDCCANFLTVVRGVMLGKHSSQPSRISWGRLDMSAGHGRGAGAPFLNLSRWRVSQAIRQQRREAF